MSAISPFHAKAKAEQLAKTEAAKDGAERAAAFLEELDQVLSEGFNEVVEAS